MPGLARGEAPPDVHGSWQNRRQRGVSSRSLLWPNSDAALAAFHWRADERPLTLAHPRVSKQVKIKRLTAVSRSAFTHRAAPYDAGPGCSVTTELVYGSAWPTAPLCASSTRGASLALKVGHLERASPEPAD